MSQLLDQKKLMSRIFLRMTNSTQRLAMTLLLLFACGQASAINLGIENEAEYSKLITAMRAAEYVRSDVIIADVPKPRVYAVLAGVMAYAERNPAASDAQLQAFVSAFDAAAKAYAPGDPNLIDPATLYATLRFAIVEDQQFDGTDTTIGERALDLLGITIPNPDDFAAIQKRMVRYEIALGRPLDYRNEVFDLLVSGFFGQDPAGNERATLPSVLDMYFRSEGFDPQLGSERIDRPNVNAGLSILPADYEAYVLAISEGDENTALRDQITAQLNTVRDQIDSIVGPNGKLSVALANAPGLAESVDLAVNNQPYIQQVVNERRADLQATAQARAATSAATYLMLQSDFADVGSYASYTRDYSQIALETNESAADLTAGVDIAGSIVIAGIGAYIGDPSVVIGGLANGIFGVFNLITGTVAPPSVEEQTFEQIVELRQQVEEMRQEMNERFDRIDQQLDIMFDTITLGFDALGNQVGDLAADLTADVDSLVRDMAEARSILRRLEASLYGVAQDILLTDLTNETNTALAYRVQNGTPLAYKDTNPNFISASESLFTYATLTSLSEAFVGSRTNPTVTLDSAAQVVGSASVSNFLNDLAVLPLELGRPTLIANGLPGIEPWSQAAAAYAQLARENPLYFSYRYGKQLDNFNADPVNNSAPELDRIIDSGEAIVSLVQAIRQTDGGGNSALFDALVLNYKAASAGLQTEIDSEIASKIENDLPLFTNGATTLDFWMASPQSSVAELTNLGTHFIGEDSFSPLVIKKINNNGGFNTWEKCGCLIPTEQIPIMQTWFLIQKEQAGEADDFGPRYRHAGGAGNYEVIFSIGNANEQFRRINRRLYYTMHIRLLEDGPFIQVATSDLNQVADYFNEVWNDIDDWISRFDVGGDTSVTDNLTGKVFSNGDSGQLGFVAVRVTITGDNEDTAVPIGVNEFQGSLRSYRTIVRNHLLDKLSIEESALSAAARKLDNAAALINAYVTVGLARELNQSVVLRSALRAVPGSSELGLGSTDVTSLVLKINTADSGSGWADQNFNVTQTDGLLNERIDLVADEIKRGLEQPAFAPDYVGWVLAELRHLSATAFNLAIDNAYIANSSGIVIVGALEGLLTNDLNQASGLGPNQDPVEITVDTTFGLVPDKGVVSVNEDGSFTYTAAPGFIGTDSFTYRSKATIAGAGPVYSEPATVVIISGNLETIFLNGFEN